MKNPSNFCPLSISFSAKTGNTSLSIEFFLSGIKSKISSSKIYEPALIKFEKTSSGSGFSLKRVIFELSSNPTIPNLVGSLTSHRPKVPIPPFDLCKLSRDLTLSDEITSPLKQANVPFTTSLQLPKAPPVPSGLSSGTMVISKSKSEFEKYDLIISTL